MHIFIYLQYFCSLFIYLYRLYIFENVLMCRYIMPSDTCIDCTYFKKKEYICIYNHISS